MGNLATAHSDHAVRNAIIVPTLAPDRNRPAAMGKLTKGPPGVKPPATVPISIPRMPDWIPTHLESKSRGKRT